MYENIATSYPSQFFYNISKISGSVSKNLIKITADNTNASPSQITNIRLPISALLNIESLMLYFKVDITSGAGGPACIPARNSSTFIKRMSITMNNTTVSIINDYNMLYNIYNDFTNKSLSKGIAGQNTDPSIIWTEGTPSAKQVGLVGANALLASTVNQTGLQLCVSDFLGFFGSASTKILPTQKTGECVISIEWANPADCLCGTAEATTATYTGSNTYTVKDIYATCEAISLSDDSYYESIGDKDLMFGFNDYIVTKFATVAKKSGINVTTYLSAGSIDHVLGTAVYNDAVPSPMVAWGALGAGDTDANVANVYKYLSDPETYSNNNSGTAADNVFGDGFFNSKNMMRDLQFLDTSSFAINNKQLNYGPLNQHEIFNNNMLALNYENVNFDSNGFHSGMVSLKHFYKYYGAVMQSLELIDKDQFTLSGLSSQGSSASINWRASFTGTSNDVEITPVLVAKLSKVLHVKSGRMISTE